MQKFAEWLPDDDQEEKTSEQGLLNSIAELRAALVAASGILSQKSASEKDDLAIIASLLYRAANEDGASRKQAIRALEEGAGYISGMGRGEAYP